MQKRRRICNVVCDLTSGGVESVLINYFTHMDCSEYDLDIMTYGITSELCAERFKALGFHIIIIPPKRTGFIKSMREMDKAIQIGNYDIVHAHLTEWNGIPMFLAWKNHVKRRISHSHMANSPTGVIQKLIFGIQKFLNKIFANKYCACGDDAGIYLYGKKCFIDGKVQVLNNAIDMKRFAVNIEERENIREELKIENTTFCVGHIGRFLEQKNHKFLIDIFYELHKKIPDSCLLLMGTGDLEALIHEKVAELNLTDYVKFLGVRNDPEKIYQAMDAFCLPSLFEGLPVVGIEAQAAGIPCLVSDQVSEKVCITPLVKMVHLEEDAALWAEELSELKGKRITSKTPFFPAKYNIDEVAQEWKQLYSGV